MNKIQWAYLAGLFDGEGCVLANQYVRKVATYRSNGALASSIGRPVLNTGLQISNNDHRVLDWIVVQFGGGVAPFTGQAASWVWSVRGKPSEGFARGILPYAQVKREQLEIYIELRQLMNTQRSGKFKEPLSVIEIRQRQRLIDKLKTVRVKHGGRALRLIQ